VPELLRAAQVRLSTLGYLNVHLATGNGSLGWPEHAPFDAILVSAAAPRIPLPLVAQLAEGGRMAIPIGTPQAQMLIQAEKRRGALYQKDVASCVFVPLIGDYGWPG